MLFDYINQDHSLGVNIKFSNLRDYFEAISKTQEEDQSLSFPLYQGDYFPYIDKDQDYWTGYFTTRPYAKGLSRRLSAAIRDANTLCSLYSTALHNKVLLFFSILFFIIIFIFSVARERNYVFYCKCFADCG